MTNSLPRKISQLNSLSALADSDIIPIVDSSATTSSASGETKRVFFSVLKSTVLAGLNTSNWNSAYSWGDHSSAGYLTNSFAETDPIFTASAASGVTTDKISNWDSAYGWGDHSQAGYLTGANEIDPVFAASAASGVTTDNISNWDSAYGWGDHASAGYITSSAETDWNTAYGWGNHANAGYLTTSSAETDPIFSASAASGVTTDNISNWDSAYGWGDHASAGYTTSPAETSRTEKNATTTSLAAGVSGDLSITAFKAYNLLKIAINHPAWVRLYVDAASRTSDVSRAEGTDPLPGSGVIAEVLTTDTGVSEFLMSPAVFGWNNNVNPIPTVYARVTNKDSSPCAITVTLTLIKAEA